MSKNITKIIAGLGVVAGLGVAALPLASYAATDTLISVSVSGSGVGTPECTSGSCTVPAVNEGKGQTITLKDKDGATFNLANTTDVPDGSGSSATGTRVIPTIATASTDISGGAVFGYGVKATHSGAGSSAYTVAPATLSTHYNPVSNSIGTFTSSGPSDTMTVVISSDHKVAPTVEPGTYTNTVSLTAVLNV